MAARTGRPYKLQVLSSNGERKLQGSANNPTLINSTHLYLSLALYLLLAPRHVRHQIWDTVYHWASLFNY